MKIGKQNILFILTFMGLTLSGASQAVLVDRGHGLIYDDVLNVTWLQDANYAFTSGYAAAHAVNNGAAATTIFLPMVEWAGRQRRPGRPILVTMVAYTVP